MPGAGVGARVVLAYSGGLDTSAILVLLREKFNAEVITVTVDVGQEEELRGVEERAYEFGAAKHYTIDAKEEFARGYVAPSIKANALYEGEYPLGSALARPLIAAKLAEVAKKEGADSVAHGCTSKGNDQVRFDVTLRALLGDDVKIIAPVRMFRLTRADSIDMLRKHGYSVPSAHKKYSIDENLWSRSIEGSELDDPLAEPPEDAFAWTVDPAKAPDNSLCLEVEFERGSPVKLNGERLGLVELISTLNRLAGSHGYGRIDHVENRVVGLKSREVYEAPAALALIKAHRDLEKLVLTPHELRFKELADNAWTDLVYRGLWVEPLREELQLFISEVNKCVSGVVRLKVHKGCLRVVGRWSPYSSYSRELIDYDRGWYPSDEEARGFATLWGMHSVAAYRARGQARWRQ